MSKYFLYMKLVTVIVLTLLMMIPIGMVMNVIDGRQYYQRQAIQSIVESTSDAQTVVAPVLVIPYQLTTIEENDEGKPFKMVSQKYRYVLPERLEIEGKVNVDARKLGIYQAQIFLSQLTFAAAFSSDYYQDLFNQSDIELFQPYFVVGITDNRGILQIPEMIINGTTQRFEPGIGNNRLHGSGIHALLAQDVFHNKASIDVQFNLQLQGTNQLAIVPVGRTTQLTMESNWPHPNFIGSFLPIAREVTEQGFSATWQSSWFANNLNERFYQDLNDNRLPAFNVGLVETVDQYQLNERAVKYAILFIFLTFVAFFLFEVLKTLRVHPMQYLLVGGALVMFYVILLALSEHLQFVFAYLIATLACVGLISFYLCAVLRSVKSGILFGSGLLILYAALFGLLHLEQYTLLVGSSLLFVIMACTMMLTRNIDWYNVMTVKSSLQHLVAEPAQQTVSITEDQSSDSNGLNQAGAIAEEPLTKLERKQCRLWK